MAQFFAGVLLFLAILLGFYFRWTRKVEAEIKEGAALEWAHYQKTEPEFLNGYDEVKFTEVYRRVHFPRFPGYALASIVSFGASLPIILALLAASQWIGGKMGWVQQPADIVRTVNLGEVAKIQPWQCDAECQLYIAEAFSGFYFFFGVLVFWLLIVAFFMRRYHRHRPGYLRDELIRNR